MSGEAEVAAGKGGAILAANTTVVVVKGRLTIKKLADKLIEIESSKGLGVALRCVDRLDYAAVCALTDSGDKIDDPASMPSRFLLLKGAKSDALKGSSHLDPHPYPVAKGLPKECGVKENAEFLALRGYLDAPRPKWWSGRETERSFTAWDEELVQTTVAQIDDSIALQPLPGVPATHQVRAGETLLSIADTYALRSWTLLWEANKANVADPSAALSEGSELILPQWNDAAVSNFEEWVEGFAGQFLSDAAGYADPRSAILDEKGRVVVRMVEVADIHFVHGGHMACIDPNGEFVDGIANALCFGPNHPNLELVVFGHADTSGEPSANIPISLRRAKSVKSILDLDPASWTELSNKAKTEEVQSALSGLSKAEGWPCDPGEVDGKLGSRTTEAIRAFQAEANKRYKLGLAVDGQCGPATWGAIHRAICGAVAKRINVDDPASPDLPKWIAPRYGFEEGEGLFPCGESFPIDQPERDSFKSKLNRRVELVFGFHGAMDLALPPSTSRNLTKQECPVYDPDKAARVPIQNLGPRDVRLFSI